MILFFTVTFWVLLLLAVLCIGVYIKEKLAGNIGNCTGDMAYAVLLAFGVVCAILAVINGYALWG